MWATVAVAHGLSSVGSIIVAHRPSCSMARGIFPEQGSKLCPLHRQAVSVPLSHQESLQSPFRLDYLKRSYFTGSSAQEGQQTLYPKVRSQRDSEISLNRSHPLWGDSCLLLLTFQRAEEAREDSGDRAAAPVQNLKHHQQFSTEFMCDLMP